MSSKSNVFIFSATYRFTLNFNMCNTHLLILSAIIIIPSILQYMDDDDVCVSTLQHDTKRDHMLAKAYTVLFLISSHLITSNMKF